MNRLTFDMSSLRPVIAHAEASAGHELYLVQDRGVFRIANCPGPDHGYRYPKTYGGKPSVIGLEYDPTKKKPWRAVVFEQQDHSAEELSLADFIEARDAGVVYLHLDLDSGEFSAELPEAARTESVNYKPGTYKRRVLDAVATLRDVSDVVNIDAMMHEVESTVALVGPLPKNWRHQTLRALHDLAERGRLTISDDGTVRLP